MISPKKSLGEIPVWKYIKYWTKICSLPCLLPFLGGAPTSVCHFFHLSIHLFVMHRISGTVPHLSDHNFWYTCLKWWYLQLFFLLHLCKMMISPGVFFIFVKFWFFRLLGRGGVKGQKMTQNEKWLHASRTISQDQYSIWSWFLVHLCKVMISPVVFFIFFKFWIFGPLGR